MERLLKSVLNVREFKLHVDDDHVDRLSHRVTVIILVCFAFIISTKQFVGVPISCWCPAQFTPSHREYADTVCWVSNTYYLLTDEEIPKERLSTEKKKQVVCYYQWAPLILIFQAILSFIPCQIWRFLNQRSGVNLCTVMDAAHVCSEASYLEVREKAIRYIVNHMDRYLLSQREFRTGCMIRIKHFIAKVCCLVGGRLYGNYLITAYLSVKILYIVVAVVQLMLMEVFLGIEHCWYGAYVVDKLIKGQKWEQSERFPRVTLCEFELRQQARVHYHIVQCALTINLFNEKIFVFVWFWFVFLVIITFINVLKWLFRSLYWPGQVQYVRRRLRAFDVAQREPSVLAKFTENYLRRDGMFILRLISMNMGEVVAGEALCGLWNNYNPDKRLMVEKHGRRHMERMRINGAKKVELV
uniref:Innexin n=1 Tax=Hirudo verbana TaxID=311461 RepID=H9C4R7_9ANNE|nr:INX17 [Hirudo verbana]